MDTTALFLTMEAMETPIYILVFPFFCRFLNVCDFVNQHDSLFSHQQSELFLFQNLFLMLVHFLSKQAYGYEENHAVEIQIIIWKAQGVPQ